MVQIKLNNGEESNCVVIRRAMITKQSAAPGDMYSRYSQAERAVALESIRDFVVARGPHGLLQMEEFPMMLENIRLDKENMEALPRRVIFMHRVMAVYQQKTAGMIFRDTDSVLEAYRVLVEDKYYGDVREKFYMLYPLPILVGAKDDVDIIDERHWKMLKCEYHVGADAALAYADRYLDLKVDENDWHQYGHCYLNFFTREKCGQLLEGHYMPRFMDRKLYETLDAMVTYEDFRPVVSFTIIKGRAHVVTVNQNPGYYQAGAFALWAAIPNLFDLAAVGNNIRWCSNVENFVRGDTVHALLGNLVDIKQVEDTVRIQQIYMRIPGGTLEVPEVLNYRGTLFSIPALGVDRVLGSGMQSYLGVLYRVLRAHTLTMKSYENIVSRIAMMKHALNTNYRSISEEDWRTFKSQFPKLIQTVYNHGAARAMLKKLMVEEKLEMFVTDFF